MRRIAWLGFFVLACSSTTEGGAEGAKSESAKSGPSPSDAEGGTTKADTNVAKPDTAKPDTKADAKPDTPKPDVVEPEPAEPKPAEPKPADPNTLPPYYAVFVGKEPHSVLVRSWGWGTVSGAERAACEANAPSVGEMMACGSGIKPKGASKVVRALGLRLDQTKPAEMQQVADWAPAPPRELWLIGSESTCKAKVGRPLVSVYSIDPDDPRFDLDDDFTILELSFELSGCDTSSGSWAPLALPASAGDDSPAALRWHPATVGAKERIDPASWTGSMAGKLPDLQARASAFLTEGTITVANPDKPDWWTQAATIPGTDIGERHFAALWRDEPPDPKAPDDYACGTYEFGVTMQTRGDATELQADAPKCDPADDECDPDTLGQYDFGELRGALVRAGKVEHLVWSDSLDYAAAPLSGDRVGEKRVVLTGAHHPESGGTDPYAVVRYCGP